MLKKTLYIFLLGLILLPAAALAADVANDSSSNSVVAQGLTVSPPIKELTIKPGVSEKITIKLANPTDQIIEVYPVVMDFTSGNDGGDPLFLDPTEKSKNYSLSSWVKFSSSKIAIAPEQIVSWECTISVPDEAGAGGHYGSVMFSSKPPQADSALTANQVGVSSMVASLLLISVPGDIKEQALVSDFSTIKSFFFKPPVDITTKITNSGNNHITPVGNVIIKNAFGTQVANYSLNETKGRILPDGTRKFAVKWDTSTSPFYKSPIGKYTAELSAIYGQQTTKDLTSKLSFWVIPMWFIFTVSGLIVVIIAIIIYRHTKKKRKFLDS